MSAEDDATIRHSPASRAAPPPRVEWGHAPPAPPKRTARPAWPWVLLGLGAVVAAGLGGWWLALAPLRVEPAAQVAAVPEAVPVPAPVVVPVVVPVPAPEPTPAPDPAALPAPSRLATLPPLMEEAAIAAHRADQPRLIRFAGNPAVFLVDYPTLAAQGAALNRVAALVEKAGLPRDRVLTEAEMNAAIARSGDSAATFYFGHNYRGADLARFFALAERDGLALSPAEEWLRAQYRLARGLAPAGQEIVLLSLAAPGPEMDEAGRATILHHELSHGRYGTDAAYAAHIRRVWTERFTEPERAAFRAFLGREGYDTAIETLMIDEAQAYLLHTPDPRFFTPAHLGLPPAEVERLRTLMREGMPP
ncbi:hypothetical protein HB662_19335 [Roseomonas frigidaquae]|uniref:Uncharacterized protein n=1 Tax=Falsiroseomonas frigidaquae TaxID=487318 RepID=A0ABX1F3R3_9PROT|nr:hypothetical protein [Falsiroseomonas frigidaquae]NKE46942.1 hypothetical protein [Falsiroseomonas frigidaquae]